MVPFFIGVYNMKGWVIKSSGGYCLVDYDGKQLLYDIMPVNIKSYCMANGIRVTLINDRTDQHTLDEFKQATGRTYVKTKDRDF